MHSTHWTQIFELSLENILQKSMNIETDSMLQAVFVFNIIYLQQKLCSYNYILPIKLIKLSHVQPIVLFEQCVNLGSHCKQLPAQRTSEKVSTLEL